MTTKTAPARSIVSVLRLLRAMSAAGSISSAMVPSPPVPAALPPPQTASICLRGGASFVGFNSRPRLTGGKANRGNSTLVQAQEAEVLPWTFLPLAHSVHRLTPCRELWATQTTCLSCQTHRTPAFYILRQRNTI